MPELEVSRTVNAPPDTVWSILVDLDGAAERISAIEAIDRLDDGDGFGVGTRWRETRTMFGRSATEEMEVTEVVPGRSYVVEAGSKSARYRSTLTVAGAPDGGSVLTMVFAAEPSGLLSRLLAATMGRLMSGPTRRALEQDLSDIASAAETA
jgi:uncharacterized protein YndB with AHSA1/START domain